MKPATVASKRLGDLPEVHYMLGPQRACRLTAEEDLALFQRAMAAPAFYLTCEERQLCEEAALTARSTTRGLLAIIERLTGHEVKTAKEVEP